MDPQSLSCPRCSDAVLQPAMTKRGVEVDRCPSCGGAWLDRGEIFYFVSNPKTFAIEMKNASAAGSIGELKSPRTGNPMKRIHVMGLEIDLCESSGGMWFDGGELELLYKSASSARVDEKARRPVTSDATEAGAMSKSTLAAYAAGMRPLPNLFARSAGALVLLYAMIGALLIAFVEVGKLSAEGAVFAGVAIAAIQFALSPFIMDLSLRFFYSCKWVDPSELPPHLQAFVKKVCDSHRMAFPRIGVIEDGAPNAFTYGHHPSNARIVITRGLFEILEERELEAVVAHEIGHAVHWDMLVMTMANLVPLIAYYVYRTLIRIRVKGKDRTAAQRLAIAIGAYVVYIVSTYIVLWLSRTRELHADRFAAEATGDPTYLASALVKIGYGLAGREQVKEEKKVAFAPRERKSGLEAIGALGIFDAGTARALAIASGQASTATFDPENLRGAMRWELWNPWAKFFELNSTHPLIATRLDHLGRQAAKMGLQPFVVFDEQQPESYWDEFVVDVVVMFLPLLLAGALLLLGFSSGSPSIAALSVAGLGAGLLFKTWFSYRAEMFPEMTIAALLKNVKVSAVRGVPCTLRGRVIGRGVPGLIWSEDFVVRDSTGIMFLDYRQPMKLLELIFGLMRRADYQDEDVLVTGWYRRAPTPYIELRTLASRGATRGCYTRHARYVFGVLGIAAGLFLAMAL